ncbi:protein phosphatase PPM4, putative (PPM4) [Plasmodium ovale wallikeri]|uniref:Protein phosphatase PPM4, putative (PPM4) n=1 Tax=Plasmodium ovale wallikeri TaxID=864142 RepID=A0A1A9A3W9_PLAOA|nr:protein phosphatase PPM4, putative (PPM4) [Plasmodium ovale wallikeri]SBT50904.1 protein phosphatase PPM4, putative (PPM4) [Plasmodium ovale wallikeri]
MSKNSVEKKINNEKNGNPPLDEDSRVCASVVVSSMDSKENQRLGRIKEGEYYCEEEERRGINGNMTYEGEEVTLVNRHNFEPRKVSSRKEKSRITVEGKGEIFQFRSTNLGGKRKYGNDISDEESDKNCNIDMRHKYMEGYQECESSHNKVRGGRGGVRSGGIGRGSGSFWRRGYRKRINDNIIDKLVHKTFNNMLSDTSKNFSLIDTQENLDFNNKRNLTMFNSDNGEGDGNADENRNDVIGGNGGHGVKREGGKYKMGQEDIVDRLDNGATCGSSTRHLNSKRKKMHVKNENNVEDTNLSKNDKFQLFCENHSKIFDNVNDHTFLKNERRDSANRNKIASPKKEKNNTLGNSNSMKHPDDVSADVISCTGDNGTPLIQKEKRDENCDEERPPSDFCPFENDAASSTNDRDGLENEVVVYPSIYQDNTGEWFIANESDDWHVHKLCNWLYNIKDKLYFYIKTQEIYYEKNGEFFKFENSFQESKNNGQEQTKFNDSFEGKKEAYGDEGDNFYDNSLLCNDGNTHAGRVNERGSSLEGNGEIGDIDNSDGAGSTGGGRRTEGSSEGGSADGCSVGSADSIGSVSSGSRKRGKPRGKPRGKHPVKHLGKGMTKHPTKNFGKHSSKYEDRGKGVRDRGNDNHVNGFESTEQNDETLEEFSMVLEDDLVCGTFSRIGNHCRGENEDFYVTKDILDLSHVSESDGLCFYSGVFDGHGGSNCARYVMSHLKTNLIAKFRQSFLITCKKQFKEKGSRLNELSVEVRALYDSCIKGFDMTDKNYLELSKKYDYKDGSTACIVLIYGPDDDGSLKVLCANCGDSGALICHNKKPIKLSLRHKPDLQEERIRILKCGGIIANINGINRIITKHKDKNSNTREKTFLALSTSRSFGDISYKIPRKIVLCKPFISVYTIDFDLDSFLVLATDGILNVLTDKEIIDIVWKNIHRRPEQAAEEVVKEATKRGSMDDKTCTVIFFYWRKDIFNNTYERANVQVDTQDDPRGEVRLVCGCSGE